MIDIVEKSKCCGCTACYNACPVNCISMKEDDEGFLFPEIDGEKCVKWRGGAASADCFMTELRRSLCFLKISL